jgi:hypothetical protein
MKGLATLFACSFYCISQTNAVKDSLNKLPFRFPIQAASRRDNFR